MARAPDGTIRLFCKGADNVMIPRIRQGIDPKLVSATQENLRLYSVQVSPPSACSESPGRMFEAGLQVMGMASCSDECIRTRISCLSNLKFNNFSGHGIRCNHHLSALGCCVPLQISS